MPELGARSQPTNWWRGPWRQHCGSRYASERGLKSGTDCACLIRALHSPCPGGLAFKAGWRECTRTHTHTLHWQSSLLSFSQIYEHTINFIEVVQKCAYDSYFLHWCFLFPVLYKCFSMLWISASQNGTKIENKTNISLKLWCNRSNEICSSVFWHLSELSKRKNVKPQSIGCSLNWVRS